MNIMDGDFAHIISVVSMNSYIFLFIGLWCVVYLINEISIEKTLISHSYNEFQYKIWYTMRNCYKLLKFIVVWYVDIYSTQCYFIHSHGKYTRVISLFSLCKIYFIYVYQNFYGEEMHWIFVLRCIHKWLKYFC